MKTHAFLAVALAFLAAGPAVAQRDADADRLCEPGSHVEQRACLAVEAHKSELRLAKAETDARSALVTVDQNEPERDHAVHQFDRSVPQFRRYRATQCDFIASLAYGGNGQGDLRLLCQIDLNNARIRYLRAAIAIPKLSARKVSALAAAAFRKSGASVAYFRVEKPEFSADADIWLVLYVQITPPYSAYRNMMVVVEDRTGEACVQQAMSPPKPCT